MVSINGLNSCFPQNKVSQIEIAEFGKSIFTKFGKDFDRMHQVYENSGVKHRFIVNELGWYAKEHSWMERNILFKQVQRMEIRVKRQIDHPPEHLSFERATKVKTVL